MKNTLLQTLLHLVLGVIILAAILWVFAPLRGAAIELAPAPTPAAILVHVDGAVQHPGIYSLPPNSRLGSAIEAAGGLHPGANSQAINLAAKLNDGDKIIIPLAGTPVVSLVPDPPPGAGNEEQGSASKPRAAGTPQSSAPEAPAENMPPVNLNTATLEELQTLPGIGPTRAEQIVAYRNTNGGFERIEELLDVPGIGPATYDNLKGRITVK